MAANPTHEKKRASTPGNFDMFFQTKTVTAQVATKAPRLNRKEIAFNGVNQDPPASEFRNSETRLRRSRWRAGTKNRHEFCPLNLSAFVSYFRVPDSVLGIRKPAPFRVGTGVAE